MLHKETGSQKKDVSLGNSNRSFVGKPGSERDPPVFFPIWRRRKPGALNLEFSAKTRTML
jgi:hypothetical protein